jgi:hypothetical protein
MHDGLVSPCCVKYGTLTEYLNLHNISLSNSLSLQKFPSLCKSMDVFVLVFIENVTLVNLLMRKTPQNLLMRNVLKKHTYEFGYWSRGLRKSNQNQPTHYSHVKKWFFVIYICPVILKYQGNIKQPSLEPYTLLTSGTMVFFINQFCVVTWTHKTYTYIHTHDLLIIWRYS